LRRLLTSIVASIAANARDRQVARSSRWGALFGVPRRGDAAIPGRGDAISWLSDDNELRGHSR
jgi:hypothetical protein